MNRLRLLAGVALLAACALAPAGLPSQVRADPVPSLANCPAGVVFRCMEDEIARAETVQVQFEAKAGGCCGNDQQEYKGTLTFTREGKARLEMITWHGEGKPRTLRQTVAVSDGTQVKVVSGDPFASTAPKSHLVDAPRSLPKRLAYLVTTGPGVSRLGVDSFYPKSHVIALQAAHFKWGKAEKVNGKNALVIEYQLIEGGKGAGRGKVWIDPETMLPLRREVSTGSDQHFTWVTETYQELRVNGKVDARLFALQ